MSAIVIDGHNALLGRLASYSAKQALLGKEIVIVNCKDVVVSGSREMILREYRIVRKKGGSSLKGPVISRVSEKMVKRTIRGMLPHTQTRGLLAFKRIRGYNGMPEEYKDVKKIKAGKEKHIKTVRMEDISRDL